MTYRIAFPLLALLAAGGCGVRDTTAPMSRTRSAAAAGAVGQADDENDTDSPRSGALQITKECSQYTRLPGSFCTITSSNLKQIPVGTRVIYASAAGTNALGHL